MYEQEFTVEGKTYTRRGFFARVRLEPFGTGRIFPHEQTMSGPKEDRLKLYRATGFNLSPGLRPLPGRRRTRCSPGSKPLTRNAPPLVAKDHLGVTNRLWVVTDSARVIGGDRADGAEAGVHRRRPPPLRDRA